MFLSSLTAYPWDLAILLILATTLGITIIANAALRRKNGSRLSRMCIGCLGVLFCFAFFLTAYGSFVEPHFLTVTAATATLKTDRPLRVVLLSDFHVGPYVDRTDVEHVVQKVNSLFPDIVLLAGDFVYLDHPTAQTLATLTPLRDIRAAYGTFAVLGNHDHGVYRWFAGIRHTEEDLSALTVDFLRSQGITVLVNESTKLSIGTDSVTIAGVDDAWSGKADLEKTMAGKEAGVPLILLSHNPDVIRDPLSTQADLIVSGHTHGGQIRLPLLGSLLPLPTRLGSAFDQGVFDLGNGRSLAITRGIGELGPRARLFAPPEIMLITTKVEK
jgi:hypothetical protein